MKYIIGGGIIGLLTREILGSEWKIIPVGKSRYYSFSPALADDFLLYKNEHLEHIKYLQMARKPPLLIRDGFSIDGALLFQNIPEITNAYLQKLYGSNPHPICEQLFKSEYFVHSKKVSDLYVDLTHDYKNELINNTKLYGIPKAIRNNIIHTDKGQWEYEEIISTIPLDKLLDLIGLSNNLESRDEHIYLIGSDNLSFEGANSVLVVDENIEFHKVTHVTNNHYIFRSFKELDDSYFSLFMEDFTIINKTVIEKSFPLGSPPDLDGIESQYNIYCIGSNAQWDYFMDIASCLNRIIHKVNVPS